MRSRPLGEHYFHFVRKTDALVRLFGSPLPVRPTDREVCLPIHRYGRGLITVRLQHFWAEFCREVVVRSALGHTTTMSGQILPGVTGVFDLADIARVANTHVTGPGANWHLPSFAIKVARTLGVKNYYQISQGLGAVSPAEDLVRVRNYLVHPNRDTRRKYDPVTWKLGAHGLDPESLLASLQVGGATLFEAWVIDLRKVAFNAVQ